MRRFLFFLALVLARAPLAFAAATLTCGLPQSGSFSTSGTPFIFAGQVGDTILIRLLVPAALSKKPVLQLVDSTGTAVTTINPRSEPRRQGGNLDDYGFYVYDLPSAGQYQFTVTGSVNGGTLQVVFVPLNRPCGGASGTLTCGTRLKDTLLSGQMQTYQFTGKAGDAISLRLTPIDGSDPSASLLILGFDSRQNIQDVSPSQSFFLGGYSGPAVIPYKLTSDGQQTFVVVEVSGTLKLNFAMNLIDFNGPCNAVSAGCGTTVDGSINDVLSTNLYSVSASRGDIYQLRLVTADSSASAQPAVQVFDSQGKEVTPSSDATRLLYTMPADGVFDFVVQDRAGTGTGKYTLSLARLNKPCNAQPLGCGATTTGQVNGPLRIVSYSVDSQAGDVYMLRLLRTNTSSSFTPRIEVYGPGSGLQVQSVITSDLGAVTFNAATAGTYNLIAYDGSSDGRQSGGFTVWLARLNRPCDGSVGLGCGFLAPGAITQPLQSGMYSYPTTAGDAFTVRLLDTGGSLQTALQVYDPRGNPVSAKAGTTKAVDVTNSPGGAYTVLVTDQSRTPQQGTFALEAFGTRGGCGSNPAQGQSVSGLVSGPVPFNSYVFNASAGDALLLRSAAFTPGFSASVDLYDPSGKPLGSGTSSVAPPVLTASGPYTAIVYASAARGSGSYAFSWQLLNNPVAQPLQCGQTISAALGSAGQFWYYSVNANDGDLLKLLLTRLPATLNAQVELFEPRGARLLGSTGDIVRKVSAGNYLVLVSPASSVAESGGFALALQRPNNPCSPGALACGQTILQPATAAGQLDAYTFSGTAGDQLSIQVTTRQGNYSPVTELYDQASATNLPVPGSPGGATLTANITATSQYTLTVHDRVGNTGSYRVGLQRANNACPVNDAEKPVISLRRPTGGEVIAGGAVFQIVWQSDDNIAVTAHAIGLSTDGGKTFQPIAGAGALSGVAQSFPWVVPSDITPSRTAVIQVTATDRAGNSQTATSDQLSVIGSGFAPNAAVTYQYDPLNRLTQATYQDGRIVQYTYDAAGNLATVTVQ